MRENDYNSLYNVDDLSQDNEQMDQYEHDDKSQEDGHDMETQIIRSDQKQSEINNSSTRRDEKMHKNTALQTKIFENDL